MKHLPFIIAICLSLGGCEKFRQNDDKSSNNYPPTQIGVLISGTSNPFFAKAYQAFQDFGHKHNIAVLNNDAQNNQEAQFAALDSMLEKGVQAVIINMVDAKQAQQVIDKLKPLKIPVVFYNRSPTQTLLFSYDKAIFLDGDAVQGGVLQGLDVLQKWKTHPQWDKNKDGVIQFAMLRGIDGNPSASARTKWSIGTMSSYPELAHPTEEIANQAANFRADQAEAITQSWIDSGQINEIEVILANNDTMALGALEALKKSGKTLPVFGIDASNDAMAKLKTGELAGTVLNDAETQAQTAMKVAINLAHQQVATKGVEQKMEYQTILIPYHPVSVE